MTRKIVNTKPVAGAKPAVRVEFAGKYQTDYFSLRKIAINDFRMSQTGLARMILCEWIRNYRGETEPGKARILHSLQMQMEFGAIFEESKAKTKKAEAKS
jgi:hypothetical protein